MFLILSIPKEFFLLKIFIFSGYISEAAALSHGVMTSEELNGIYILASKWTYFLAPVLESVVYLKFPIVLNGIQNLRYKYKVSIAVPFSLK